MDDGNVVGRSHEGEWWLPGDPDNKVAGRLVVSEVGRSTLHLIGSLGVDGRIFREPEESALSIIHGLVENRGFTLDRCFQTHLSGALAGGQMRQTVHVHRVLAGAYLFTDPFDAHQIQARMDGFVYWVNRSGLTEEEGVSADTRRPWFAHRLDVLPEQKVTLADGGKLTIWHNWSITGDMQAGRSFEQDFSVILAWDESIHVDELLRRLGLLQDLVTVAVGRPAAYRRVLVRDNTADPKGGPRSRKVATSVDMVANWTVRSASTTRPLRFSDVRFTLEQMGGLPMLARWLEVAGANRSMLARVMATQSSEDMYVSDQVMNCAAAIEAYDKKRHGTAPLTPGLRSVTFREQVERCATYAGPEFVDLIGDVGAWATTLKKHRTDVAHHLEQGEDASEDALGVAAAARWMFLFCLFRDCGFPQVVFEKCASASEWIWLRHRLRTSGVVGKDSSD